MDLRQHLSRQAAFSRATFGPYERTKGVSDHVRKELVEIEEATDAAGRSREWTDVVLLGLDGLLRSCREQCSSPNMGVPNNSEIADMACRLIREKQEENEMRDWPDWRTMSEDEAIEHDRSKENTSNE